MQFGFLLEQVVNGLVLGGYYLLIALGLSLIFSVGGIVNLAHGAFYAIGAYLTLVLSPYLGFGGSFGDVDHADDLRPSRRHPASRPTPGTACTQARCQFFAQLTLGLHEDRLIDRLVRHPPLWLVEMLPTQPPGDLLG